MNIFKKILALGTMSVLLTACLEGNPLLEYNRSATGNYKIITETLDEIDAKMAAEIEKEKDINFDFLNEDHAKIRKAISDIKALTVPAGEGVQGFHTALTQLADQVEEVLKINDRVAKAIQGNNEKALATAFTEGEALSSKLGDLEDKVIAAQEEMAKKNNFDLQ